MIIMCRSTTAGYMLEADPEKRPNVWQVSEVLCKMQGKVNRMPNVYVRKA
jgi:hypothetical protein